MELGTRVWIPVELVSQPYAVPSDVLQRPAFLPASIEHVPAGGDDGYVLALDWDRTVKVSLRPSDVSVRDPEDEATAASPSSSSLLLKYPSPASICSVLEKRFLAGSFGVHVGESFVWMNPVSSRDVNGFQGLSFPSSSTREPALGSCRHPSTFSEKIRKRLFNEGHSQAIFVMGCSGSGKSELAKSILYYFLNRDAQERGQLDCNSTVYHPLGSSRNPLCLSDSRISKGVAAAICLFDAFGSAPSCQDLNKPSSRIIRHFKLNFGANATLSSVTSMLPVLLDPFPLSQASTKSKAGRGPYTVLSMMLAANLDRLSDLRIGAKQAATYFGYSNVATDNSGEAHLFDKFRTDLNVKDLAREFVYLRELLVVAGMPEPLWDEVIKALAACVHLQTVTVTTKPDFSADTKAYKDYAERLLLGSASTSLGPVILRRVESGVLSSEFKTYADARATCDMIVSEVYQRVLRTLLSYCGARAAPSIEDIIANDDPFSVDIVDMPGNDWVPALNVLGRWGTIGDLATNYGVERLLQHFSETVFDRELNRYIIEGVAFAVARPTCTDFVELFEKPSVGMLSIMADVCQMPKPDDKLFLERILTSFGSKPHALVRTPLATGGMKGRSASQFIINHSFGEVGYDSEGFLSTARARMTPPVSALLAGSTLDIVARGATQESQEQTGESTKKFSVFADKSAALSSLTLQKHKDVIGKLLETLHTRQTHYALCIRPTPDLNDPRFHATTVTPQLNALHVTGLCQLSQSPYKTTYSFADFFKKYRVALPLSHPILPLMPLQGALSADLCRTLYEEILLDASISPQQESEMETQCGIVFGKAGHVFVSQHIAETLDAYRSGVLRKFNLAASLVQSVARMKLARTRFCTKICMAMKILACVRRYLRRAKDTRTKNASMKLLSFFLMVKWRFHFCRMRLASTFLKSRFAGKMIDRLRYSRLKKGARAFSHIIRGFTIKSEISKVTRSALTLQYSLSYLVGRKKRSRLRNGAATRIQCLFRSWICRDQNSVIVYELASKRKNRLIGRVVLTLQSRHRSRLVRSRKAQLVEATQCLQHWCKGLREREAFLLKRRLACMLQQLVRRSLAILRVHNHRASAMLKLEAVHNDLVRNEELSTVRTLHPCELRLGQISSRQGHKRVSRYLIGFDVTFDVGAAYPGGWIVTLMRFTEMLSREKRTLVHVAIGGQHTILVDDNSNIYSFGFGDHGQLGHGNRRKQPNPLKIENLTEMLATASSSGPKLNGLRGSGSRFVREICCGRDHTLLLVDTGCVWTFGANRKGQLGIGSFESSSTARILMLNPALSIGGTSSGNDKFPVPVRNIKQVACGSYFSACLSDSGLLYTWGSPDCIGRPCEQIGYSSWPVVVPFFHLNIKGRMPIAFVACGDYHTVVKCCATVRNVRTGVELFAWGHNEAGQLGIGDRTSTRLWPTRVLIPITASGSPAKRSLNTNIRLASTKNVTKPQTSGVLAYSESDMANAVLCCGENHCVFSLKGDVWAWGCNSHGQIGNGTRSLNVFEPQKVVSGGGSFGFVKSVVAGWRCSFAVTHSKTVLLWGKALFLGKEGGVTLLNGRLSDVLLYPTKALVPSDVFEPGVLRIGAFRSSSMTVITMDVDDSALESNLRGSSVDKSVSPTHETLSYPNRSSNSVSPRSPDPTPRGESHTKELPSSDHEEITFKFREMGSIHSAVSNSSSAMTEVLSMDRSFSKQTNTEINASTTTNSARTSDNVRFVTRRSSCIITPLQGTSAAAIQQSQQRDREKKLLPNSLIDLFRPFGRMRKQLKSPRKQSLNHNVSMDSLFAKKRGSLFSGKNSWFERISTGSTELSCYSKFPVQDTKSGVASGVAIYETGVSDSAATPTEQKPSSLTNDPENVSVPHETGFDFDELVPVLTRVVNLDATNLSKDTGSLRYSDQRFR